MFVPFCWFANICTAEVKEKQMLACLYHHALLSPRKINVALDLRHFPFLNSCLSTMRYSKKGKKAHVNRRQLTKFQSYSKTKPISNTCRNNKKHFSLFSLQSKELNLPNELLSSSPLALIHRSAKFISYRVSRKKDEESQSEFTQHIRQDISDKRTKRILKSSQDF